MLLRALRRLATLLNLLRPKAGWRARVLAYRSGVLNGDELKWPGPYPESMRGTPVPYQWMPHRVLPREDRRGVAPIEAVCVVSGKGAKFRCARCECNLHRDYAGLRGNYWEVPSCWVCRPMVDRVTP